MKASSHSKHIHSAGVTLLCPTDDAFNEELKLENAAREEENQDALDAFVGHHVHEGIMTYDDFKLMENIWTCSETHDGQYLGRSASKPMMRMRSGFM